LGRIEAAFLGVGLCSSSKPIFFCAWQLYPLLHICFKPFVTHCVSSLMIILFVKKDATMHSSSFLNFEF
ncbi:hypothetical protein, partial [Trichocoleus sp. FACHB-591]|uniref:hypothetical protein n=1 Tax=Trichocoleus sp. FACHB-591 TaxID=2692872 RepID=UPI001A7EEBCD